MMAMALTDIVTIPLLETAETLSIAARWKRWMRALELFADGKGIIDAAQKKALLLHTAGMAVQDIFFTLELLEGEEGETVYEIAKRTLTQHFTPHSNIPYERHVFRSMSQQTSESVEQFISRLRIKQKPASLAIE